MKTAGKELSDVGKFLRQLRFNREESQEDMAVRLGVTTPYISLLGGKQPITKKLAVKIIQSYNLSDEEKAAFIDLVTRDVVQRFWEN